MARRPAVCKTAGLSLIHIFYSILEPYGVTPVEGVVVEGDRAHYALNTPAALMPDMASSTITDALIAEGYYIIMPVASGLEVGTNSTSATVTSLLTTSDAAFSKLAGYDMTTYEKEDGDIDGPFSLAVSVEYGDGGGIVWFSSSSYLNDLYNAYSSGANNDLTTVSYTHLDVYKRQRRRRASTAGRGPAASAL